MAEEDENLVEVPELVLIDKFNGGSPELRLALRELFPEYEFPLSIFERVTTFEEACVIKGVDPDDVTGMIFPEWLPATVITALIRLSVITEVTNEGWTADMNNPQQEKFWPLLEITSIGSPVSAEPFLSSGAVPSSPLCLACRTREIARYIGSQFTSDCIALSSMEPLPE